MNLFYGILYAIGGIIFGVFSIIRFPLLSVTSRCSVILCAIMAFFFAEKKSTKEFFSDFLGRYAFFCFMLGANGGFIAPEGIGYFFATNILPFIFYLFTFFQKRKEKK